ncbi:MAG: DUF1559 domain-containing protein [Gemmataceae bacterium]
MKLPRPGFTLLELIVALAIFALLAGLAAAAIGYARAAVLRTRCLNHMRQQALAILSYESGHGRLPPGAISGPFEPLGAPEGVSHGLWPVLLSQLGEDVLARHYRFDVSHDDAINVTATSSAIAVLRCPADSTDPLGARPAWANYGPIEVNAFWADIGLIEPAATYEGVLPVNGMVKLSDLTDGASQTILHIEAPAANPWSSPATMVSARLAVGVGRHRTGANIAMADGAVRSLGADLALRELARLVTRAGGD